MKHIKTFEAINKPPQIGDYVIINIPENNIYRKSYLDVINTIGQITDIRVEHGGSNSYYIVKFEIIKDNQEFGDYGAFNNMGSKSFIVTQFDYWSDDKSDLEALKNKNKFNI